MAITTEEQEKEKREIKQYEFAFNQVLNEGNLVWNSSTIFLLANTFIIGFMSQQIDRGFSFFSFKGNSTLFMLAVMGFLTSLIWLFAFRRRWKWYELRMAQASSKEEVLKRRSGEGWTLLSGISKDFSDGHGVVFNGRVYQQDWSARTLGTSNNTVLFIWIFLVFYFITMIFTKPFSLWSNTNKSTSAIDVQRLTLPTNIEVQLQQHPLPQ